MSDEAARRTERRSAGRVILVDGDGRILLFEGRDPSRPEAGTWWFTPGGGLEPGESPAEGAVRELAEESGLRLEPGELGPVVLERRVEFEFEGRRFVQDETFFAVRIDRHDVTTDRWTSLERRAMTGHRWWTIPELEATSETVYPEGLAERCRAL